MGLGAEDEVEDDRVEEEDVERGGGGGRHIKHG